MKVVRIKSPINEAKRVLEEYKMKSIPINVEALCKELKIKLYNADLSEIESIVKYSISGLIQKRQDGTCVILVNEKDIEPRRRFTIAHEIGHYFLHMRDEETGIITSFRGDRSPRETEANSFAAELLMPEDLLLNEYKKLVIPVSETLASVFNVSKQAMQIRLENMELLYV